jgi:hypothetical protein
MGRPRQNIPRDQQLNVALTRPEFDAIRAKAALSGRRSVDYARAVLLGKNSVDRRVPGTVHERLCHEQLKRIGNNLNQIAKMLNTYRLPPPPDLEPLLREIRRLIAVDQSP